MKDIVNDFLNGSIQLKITSDSEWGAGKAASNVVRC